MFVGTNFFIFWRHVVYLYHSRRYTKKDLWSGHYVRRSLGQELSDIHEVITSTSSFISLETSARRILESPPNLFPTSYATAPHGVPTVKLAKSSPPMLTASATAGGTSGSICLQKWQNVHET